MKENKSERGGYARSIYISVNRSRFLTQTKEWMQNLITGVWK